MPESQQSDLTLSPDQAAAVASNDLAVVVVASAGTGKTEVVARRVQRMLLDDPNAETRVLALTYTIKASDELRERLMSRLGPLSQRVDTETVHGFAHSILRRHGTKIGLPLEPELLVRDEDRAELLGRWLEEQGRDVPTDLPAVLRSIDLARACGRNAEFLGDWEEALEGAKALDYPALLTAATRLLDVPSTRRQLARLYRQVIVDEAQNLTLSQYLLLARLIGTTDHGPEIPTMFVGDDKQSIVSFAGADPGLIRRFIVDFGAAKYQLSANFRSARAIATAADAIARRLGHEPRSGDYAAAGEILRHDAANEWAEADVVATWVSSLLTHGLNPAALAADESPFVQPEDIAVLARSGAALRHVTHALEQRGITVAASSSSADWLSSRPGQVAMEIVALRTASDHQSTHWQLARLLETHEEAVRTVSDLAAELAASSDPTLSMLAPLCDVEDVSTFVDALNSVVVPTDSAPAELAGWQSDVEQIGEAWTRFDEQAARSAVSWGNFKLHCSRQQRGDDLAPGVRVLTIHKAQGREFRAVALIGLNDGQLPDFRARSNDELLAELRTFYVAVSRPQRSLLLTRSRTRETRYGSRVSDPSRFLTYLPISAVDL